MYKHFIDPIAIPTRSWLSSGIFSPQIEARNRRLSARLNGFLHKYGFAELALDSKKDVVPLPEYANGGSITGRHILFASSRKLLARMGQLVLLSIRMAPRLTASSSALSLLPIANASRILGREITSSTTAQGTSTGSVSFSSSFSKPGLT